MEFTRDDLPPSLFNDGAMAATRRLERAYALDDLGEQGFLVPTITGFVIAEGKIKASPAGDWAKVCLLRSSNKDIRSIVPETHLLLGWCLFKIAESSAEGDSKSVSYYTLRLGSIAAELASGKSSADNLAKARSEKKRSGEAWKATLLEIYYGELRRTNGRISGTQIAKMICKRLRRKYTEHEETMKSGGASEPPPIKNPGVTTLLRWAHERKLESEKNTPQK